ncbi:Uncharacterised protein [Vibrio cholerae]|nr:Uncharacterised protein [Vibrio cholerae]CSI71827.1 Uncharacterised protein [Vibrio cholerae]
MHFRQTLSQFSDEVITAFSIINCIHSANSQRINRIVDLCDGVFITYQRMSVIRNRLLLMS